MLLNEESQNYYLSTAATGDSKISEEE